MFSRKGPFPQRQPTAVSAATPSTVNSNAAKSDAKNTSCNQQPPINAPIRHDSSHTTHGRALHLSVVFDARCNRLEEHVVREMRGAVFANLLSFIDRCVVQNKMTERLASGRTTNESAIGEKDDDHDDDSYSLSVSLHLILGNALVQQFPMTCVVRRGAAGGEGAAAACDVTSAALNHVRTEIRRQLQLAEMQQSSSSSNKSNGNARRNAAGGSTHVAAAVAAPLLMPSRDAAPHISGLVRSIAATALSADAQSSHNHNQQRFLNNKLNNTTYPAGHQNNYNSNNHSSSISHNTYMYLQNHNSNAPSTSSASSPSHQHQQQQQQQQQASHTVIHADTDPSKLHAMAIEHIHKQIQIQQQQQNVSSSCVSSSAASSFSSSSSANVASNRRHLLLLFSCCGKQCGFPSAVLQQKATAMLLNGGGGGSGVRGPHHNHNHHRNGLSASAPSPSRNNHNHSQLTTHIVCYSTACSGPSAVATETPLSPFITIHRRPATAVVATSAGGNTATGVRLFASPSAVDDDTTAAGHSSSSSSLFANTHASPYPYTYQRSAVAVARPRINPPNSAYPGQRQYHPINNSTNNLHSLMPPQSMRASVKETFFGAHRHIVGERLTTVVLELFVGHSETGFGGSGGFGGGQRQVTEQQQPHVRKKRRLQVCADSDETDCDDKSNATTTLVTGPTHPAGDNDGGRGESGAEHGSTSLSDVDQMVCCSTFPFPAQNRRVHSANGECIKGGDGGRGAAAVTLMIVGTARCEAIDEERLFGVPWSVHLPPLRLPAPPPPMPLNAISASSSYVSPYLDHHGAGGIGDGEFDTITNSAALSSSSPNPSSVAAILAELSAPTAAADSTVLLLTTSHPTLMRHYGIALPSYSSSSSSRRSCCLTEAENERAGAPLEPPSTPTPAPLTLIGMLSGDRSRLVIRGLLSDTLLEAAGIGSGDGSSSASMCCVGVPTASNAAVSAFFG